jgi:glycosyltransferase involved in cell wall biosynthesis
MAIPISAIVLTKNEGTVLADCLTSLQWADELLVVDSFSTDATMDVAQRYATRVTQHPFANFAAQRNIAQDEALHDWVLFVDADERVSPELRDHIKTLAQEETLPQFNGYFLNRVQLFSGVWWPDPAQSFMAHDLHCRAHSSTVGTPRLFNRWLGRWVRPLHEVAQIPKPHGLMNGVLYHYSTSNLSLTLAPFNHYTDLEAAGLHLTRQTHVSLLEALMRAFRHFVYVYFHHEWWRYGEQGALLGLMSSYAKFMNYMKLDERIRIQNNLGTWTERDRQLLTSSHAEEL